PPLPPYSVPSLPPSYSPDPFPGEESLAQTPGVRTQLTGTYIKRCGADALGLNDQDLGATIPAYGGDSPIHGFVSLENRETVCEIVLNVYGKMDVIVSAGGSLTTNLMNMNLPLWSWHTPTGTSSSTCPSVVPFSVSLPAEFRDHHGLPHLLPPTYEIPFAAARGLLLKISYMLWVSITRSGARFRFLSTRNIISIYFKYAPRARPSRPIRPATDFLSGVKMMPEEFRQVVVPLVATSAPATHGMELHIFLPAVEVFDLKEIIPFHVHLNGRVSALREFVSDPTPNQETVTTRTIVGTVVREITVHLDEHSSSRSLTIGYATMIPRPPDVNAHEHEDKEVVEAFLDWEGELRCRADTMVAAFDAGCVHVQDFIRIELVPRCPSTRSAYATLSHLHPIRL
ncbi:hypothetical protein C8R45DRAFT_1156508, partial [Mycena sanguinolenta]